MALPWFAFYARDWLASSTVARLTLEEEGAFIRLLAHGWEMDGIPADRRELATLLRLKPGSERAERIIGRLVGLAWKPDADDPRLLRNDRQERERASSAKAYRAQTQNLALARAANPKNQTANRKQGKPTPIKTLINTEINTLIKAGIKDVPENHIHNNKQQFSDENGTAEPPGNPDAFGAEWRATLQAPTPPERILP